MTLFPVRARQEAKGRKRWRRIGAGALAALIAALILAFAGVARAQPTIAAIACPQCFGFQRVQGNLFVDREMPAGSRASLLQAEGEARQRVAKFYGGYSSDPVILACPDAP